MRARVRVALTLGVLAAAVVVGAAGVPAGAAVTVTVSPATGLYDRHPVTITATGLEPGGDYLVRECAGADCQRAPSPPPDLFLAPDVGIAHADGAGNLSATLQLDRDPTYAESDCTVVACTVQVAGPIGETIVVHDSPTLTFHPTGTYQWPQATLLLDQTSGLIDRKPIMASGSGYDPWGGGIHYTVLGTAAVEVCRAVANPIPSDCTSVPPSFESYNDLSMTAVGWDGDVGGPIRPRRHLDLPSGSWDCAIGGCTLGLSQGSNPVSNRVPISFAPEWAPWPNVDSFLDRAVTGVLGRKPTAAGRARLRSELQTRTTTGVEALVSAAAGSRLDADVGEVVRIYRAFVGRPPETPGLTYWIGRLRSGMTPLQMGRAFGATQEFKARYSSLSHSDAVTLTYRTVLGRDPSAGELEYWRGRLAGGMTAGDMVYSFARTPEHRSRTNRGVWSTIVLWRLLGYAPSPAQLAGGPERAATDALATAQP